MNGAQNYRLSLIMRLLAIGISSVGMLLLLPFVLNKLGEYNFGLWGTVSSITSYLLLLDFGIALACTRYLSIQATDKKQWPIIISNSLVLALGIAALLLLAAFVLAYLTHNAVWGIEQQLTGWVICVVLLEVALSIPLRMYLSILRTEVRYVDIGIFEVIRVLLRIGGIALALHLGADLLQIVMLAALVNVLFFVFPLLSCYLRHKTTFFSRAAVNRQTLKELLHFSKFTAISQSAEFLKFRTDSVLIALLLGITAAAHYTIIVFIIMMITQILMRFMSYWDTIIIREVGANKLEAAEQTVLKALEIGLTLSLLACLNLYIYGEFFIELWVGEQYLFLHNTLMLLALVLFSITFQLATTPYLNALKQEKTNASIDFSEVVLKFLLLLPMTTLFGFSGFIINSIIAASICGIGLRIAALAKHSTQSISTLCQYIVRTMYPISLLVLLILGVHQLLLSVDVMSPLIRMILTGLMQIAALAFLYASLFKFSHLGTSRQQHSI